MARHEKLIAFLEEEAAILRHRIEGLSHREFLAGVTTGDGTPGRIEQMESEARARLAEVEGHLHDLRHEVEAGAGSPAA